MTTIEEAQRQAEQRRVNELSVKLGGSASNMTVRDYFAAKALQSLLVHRVSSRDEICERAYLIADSMIKERAK